MALDSYFSGWAGIGNQGAYLFMFILTWNPAIFKAFKMRHYPFLFIGFLLSFFNHRAIIPFLLLTILDLDYSKIDKEFIKTMAFFFFIAFLLYGATKGGVV
jgi:hypothetical protein